ncbi:LysR family transcriptional regulator [Leptothrix discophora]|uniref:LysR family transcriptional regulator n=1 Tax=Leptothrix discophora TaxID=89 RepID=A0ABT9G2H3_LEPDI|nr:LysR family transcriptional regulator [Leptothrix discophora]MDP4300685.1 LysR family transcriptional regulator [Leptothrix discophora]
MDLNALVLFVDIVDAGNLSLAARNLKMSRANVSYHLTQLEKSVGQQLMRRTTRRVEPTEVGQRLYEHGRVIRNEWQAARETVAMFGKALHGSVRLSVPTGFGHLVMSPWLIDFKRRYPDIALELLFDNQVDDLLRDEVDLAVRVMSEPPQNLIAIELGRVRYVLCASLAHLAAQALPASPADLARVPLITSAVSGRDLKVTAYRVSAEDPSLPAEPPLEIKPHPTLASENFQFLREAILAGLGVGLVPDYVVAQDVSEGRLVTALDDWRLSVFGSRLHLLRMPGRYQTLATRTLIDFIVDRAHRWAGRSSD